MSSKCKNKKTNIFYIFLLIQPILDLSSLDMPPELPMEPVEEPKVEPQTTQEKLDLQKEMEAKFDELFGTLNDID